jgi:putative holliday junction resolvase
MRERGTGTVLAFDFGEKRIGVAVADLAAGIAHPLQTLHAEDNKTRFAAIAALITEWKPQRLIVGEPHHADGGAHEIGRLARRFAQRLQGRFNLPVTLVDETLSTAIAESRLHEQGVHGSRLKSVLDSEAACEILQTWLEQQRKLGQ